MNTPQEPGIDEPVTLAELSDYLVGGLLSSAQEERLLVRIARDPDAPTKMAKLEGIDARIRSALDQEGRNASSGDDPGPMDHQRAARLQVTLADLALQRAEQPGDAAPDTPGEHGTAT